MKNILLILRHEFVTRVSKRSFVLMTLLGPVLIGLFYGSIGLLSYYQLSESDHKKVAVYDPFQTLGNTLGNSGEYSFHFTKNAEEGLAEVEAESSDALLSILDKNGDSARLTALRSFSITDKQKLESILNTRYFHHALNEKGLSVGMIDSLRHDIVISDRLVSGELSATEIKSGIGYVGAIIIYMFIFMYGVMIMRGVTEEKNNRIVEILISAVRPFELMMGKILGLALVGLTQFVAWIVLSGLLLTVLGMAFGAGSTDAPAAAGLSAGHMEMDTMGMVYSQLMSLNFTKILVGFMLFFLGGFLLYSSIFAAIGSAVDSDTETQQFMFPVSMPLVFGLVIAQIAVIKDPNSSLAFWSSMIPFTSPVVIMVRLPFDISWAEILGSAAILFGSFILTVWLAGRIYRIGILSYGQKASYRQMLKWLMMKD